MATAAAPPTDTDATGRCHGKPFRQHTVPPILTSPLLGQLCREWVDLNTDPATATRVEGWGRIEPALAGLRSPGAVVDHLDASPRRRVDQVLSSLLRLLHRGDQLAGRVLLQAMLGCLTNLARRCRTPRDVTDPDEQLQRAITEFWAVIAQPRPLPRDGLAGRLQLDTLKRLTAHRRSPDAWEEHTSHQDPAVYPADVPDLAAGARLRLVVDNDPPTFSYDPDAGLCELILKARVAEVLTAAEAQFLVDVYLDPERAPNLRAAAQGLGLSPVAVRQRCSRIRRRLISAVLADSHVSCAQRKAG